MRKKINWRKIIVRTFLFSCLAFILMLVIANLVVSSNASGKVFDDVKDCPSVNVALVLGTSKNTSRGGNNYYFSNRIDATVELYKAGKVKYIVVSGDNSTASYDEPTDMKNALVEAGIPAEKIYLDYAGFRTLDSMERIGKVFGQKEVIIVSQRFHNERAIYLGEHFGLTCYGYNAKDVARAGGFKTKVRERFARVKVFWDILFGVDSKFLGKPVKVG